MTGPQLLPLCSPPGPEEKLKEHYTVEQHPPRLMGAHLPQVLTSIPQPWLLVSII